MPDLIFGLGPNCRMAHNLRMHHGMERAYPFDWWVTPTVSMLRMIQPGFRFHIERSDLEIIPQETVNSVWNRRLGVLMHHDFVRDPDDNVQELPQDRIDFLNAKYAALFERMLRDIEAASSPVAVMNGVFASSLAGIGSDDAPAGGDAIVAIRQALGMKLLVLIVGDGPECFEEHPGGLVIVRPDCGERELPDSESYAEPVHVFRDAFKLAGDWLASGQAAA